MAMRYAIDVASSEISWRGFLPATSLSGRIFFSEGMIDTDSNGDITGGVLTVDMNSIDPQDNKLDMDNRRKLANELRSEHFFDTAIYPVAEFRILEVNALGERADSCNTDGVIQPTHEVTGELILKGIKQKVNALVHLLKSERKMTVQTMLTLDRAQWGIDHMIDRANGNKRILPDMEIMVRVVADAIEEPLRGVS